MHTDQDQSAKIGISWASWTRTLIAKIVIIISITNHLFCSDSQMSMGIDLLVMQRILKKTMGQINKKIMGDFGQTGSLGKIQRAISILSVLQKQTKHIQPKWPEIFIKKARITMKPR